MFLRAEECDRGLVPAFSLWRTKPSFVLPSLIVLIRGFSLELCSSLATKHLGLEHLRDGESELRCAV